MEALALDHNDRTKCGRNLGCGIELNQRHGQLRGKRVEQVARLRAIHEPLGARFGEAGEQAFATDEEPGSDGADGALARGFHLAARGRQPLSDDPRVIGLEAEARDLVADISALKRTRVGLSDEIYDQRLEELLLGLARNRRALREGRQP